MGLGVLSLGLWGCAGSGVSYQGKSQVPVARGEQLDRGGSASVGAHQLGSVSAMCQRSDVAHGFEGATWSEIGCSHALLRAAISQRAAASGASQLVSMECTGRPEVDTELSCTAEAWGPESPAEFEAPNSVRESTSLEGREERAWHVHLESQLDERLIAEHGGEPDPWQPVRPQEVRELAVAGVVDFRLGDLTAYCDPGACDEADLRHGLRAAAGRIGAHSLIGVRCVTQSDGPRCVASVARTPQEK